MQPMSQLNNFFLLKNLLLESIVRQGAYNSTYRLRKERLETFNLL